MARWSAWIAPLLWLSGCVTPDHPAEPTEQAPATCLPWTSSILLQARITAGDYHVNFAGYVAYGGQYWDIPWAGDRDLLDELRVQATWDTPPGGQERFRITVYVSDPYETEALEVLQLPSPVDVNMRVHPDIPRAGSIQVQLALVDDDQPFGSLALVEQDVALNITQHYPC